VWKTFSALESLHGAPVDVAGEFVLSSPPPSDSQHDPLKYDLFAADSLRLGGKFFKTHSCVEGIGAPFVAVGRSENIEFQERYESPRVYAPVTATMKFTDQRARLEFYEPFVSDRVRIDNHLFPLAADYDSPMAMLLSRERPDKLGFIRLLRPEKYANTARLIRLQPFDPARTPRDLRARIAGYTGQFCPDD
jgi:hypothetical protein